MSNSHDKLPKLFWVQLALAAIIGIIYLTTPAKQDEEHGASEGTAEKVAKNLAPVGAVATQDAKASGSAKARSGEEVYKASCMACHASGVANAPKLDDKAAWEPRVATGLDALMKTAINGKGAMPPRGGNPAITDEEIKATIIYMTGKAGFNLSAETKQAPATKIAETQKVIEKVAPATAAIATATTPSAPTAPVAPTAPKVVNDVAAAPEAMPKTEAVAATEPATTATDNAEGEKVYKNACFACHDAGVAGSPKIGDKAAWTTRIATGNEALYTSAISGKGIMPPKGGNMGLSDDAVKAAVDFMIAKSK